MDEIFTAAFWVALWRDQWPVVTPVTLLFVISFIVGWKLRKDDREIRELRAGVLYKREIDKKELNDTLMDLGRAHDKVEALFRQLA